MTQPLIYETDGFETLPSSRTLSREQIDEIYRQGMFKCPVCGLSGGPKFSDQSSWQVAVTYQGLRIPADHTPECLETARNAYAYIHGLMDDRQAGTFIHTADASECSHPKCVAERLWKK